MAVEVTDNARTIINKTINIDPNQKLLEPSWMNQWKEVLAYVFAAVIAFDFIVAPTMVMIINTVFKLGVVPWAPLTLQGGGLLYMAMGAILSVGAYGSMLNKQELIKNLPDNSNAPTGTSQ